MRRQSPCAAHSDSSTPMRAESVSAQLDLLERRRALKRSTSSCVILPLRQALDGRDHLVAHLVERRLAGRHLRRQLDHARLGERAASSLSTLRRQPLVDQRLVQAARRLVREDVGDRLDRRRSRRRRRPRRGTASRRRRTSPVRRSVTERSPSCTGSTVYVGESLRVGRGIVPNVVCDLRQRRLADRTCRPRSAPRCPAGRTCR